MSLNGDRKAKLMLSLRKVKKKNVEEYFSNSEYDTTSTGSNESEGSTAPSKPETPEPSIGSKSLKAKVKSASKTLRKKFLRHFPTVEHDEEVLNRYSCALLGDILLQGHLYITKNYFAFYSNVFGYVTKILIPIITVEKITKEKTARILPNAIGIATLEQKHVFGSFMSRDSTLEYVRTVWDTAKSESPAIMDSEIIEEDLDSSEFEEAEDGKASTRLEDLNQKSPPANDLPRAPKVAIKTTHFKKVSRHRMMLMLTTLLLILLYLSASVLLYRICQMQNRYTTVLKDVTGTEADVLYNQLMQWQAHLHAKSDGVVYSYLDANLNEIEKVKQSLEALSSLLTNVQVPLADENSSSDRASEVR